MSGKFMMNGIEYLGGSSGGGGGNVDDVYVNGESVLDENKIAQVTSYKEVTLAEYMALPDTKLNDGIMYCIKDVGGANQFPPLIYSDEEREVGVWRDGKPLYQKSILLAGISIATGQYVIVYTQANIELKYANGYFIEGNYVYTVPEPFLRIRQDGNNIVFRAMEPSAWDISSGVLTIRYTKTTDTPGSGTWTTDGTYAKHYSTEEKVIGTWIDGKPIYECSWEFSPMLSVPPVSWTNTSITVASKNFNKIVGCEAVSGDGDIWGCISAGCTNGATQYIQLMSSRQQYNVSIEKLTLRYTKTTD